MSLTEILFIKLSRMIYLPTNIFKYLDELRQSVLKHIDIFIGVLGILNPDHTIVLVNDIDEWSITRPQRS